MSTYASLKLFHVAAAIVAILYAILYMMVVKPTP
jgi:hypothetical protein